MTVSERIFELIKERGYTQKEFSKRTGIAESTISDWKKKGTNPVSDKILIICEVLEVSPYFLLSGAENKGERSRENKTLVVSKSSVPGEFLSYYEKLDDAGKKKALDYLKKLAGAPDKAKEDKEPEKKTVKVKETVKAKEPEKDKAQDKDKEKDKAKVIDLPEVKMLTDDKAGASGKPVKEKKKKDKDKDKEKAKDTVKEKDKDKDREKDKDKKKKKKKKKKGYLLDH